MSGVEIGIAVIGAVAALVTAYRDAGGIVQSIKERRKAKGALPPSIALQESLEEGHQEIEKITAKGIQRFGTGFEQGDDIAHRALQSLTIEVQASFLHHLTLASKDDNVTDFEACIDSAIGARLQAVTILNELYLRQQKSASVNCPEPEATIARTSTTAKDAKDTKDRRGDEASKAQNCDSVLGSEMPTPNPPTTRRSSWNLFKNLLRSSSLEVKNEGSVAPSVMRNFSFNSSPPSLTPRTTVSTSPGSTNDLRQSQMMTPPISPVSTDLVPDPLAAAGFCTGASYVQQGIYEKSVQVSMKNFQWSCHCRRCPFATLADRDERGRPQFDDRIYATNQFRFRSLLLFKSHLSSSQSKRRLYKCIICILAGDHSPTYEGERHFFEHISHHQGGTVGNVQLSGPVCLEPTGVRVGSEGTFDLCFSTNMRMSLSRGGTAPEDAIMLDDDGVEASDADEVFKNQWLDEGRR